MLTPPCNLPSRPQVTYNCAVLPGEEKYRKLRLSNNKIKVGGRVGADGLPGGRRGWQAALLASFGEECQEASNIKASGARQALP